MLRELAEAGRLAGCSKRVGQPRWSQVRPAAVEVAAVDERGEAALPGAPRARTVA
jgi:hypothetical protein